MGGEDNIPIDSNFEFKKVLNLQIRLKNNEKRFSVLKYCRFH